MSSLKSDRLNHWLTLGANLGVLVGIILLIMELDQNREMMRAQVRHDIASQTIDELRALASDAVLTNIIIRQNSGEELSEAEELQARTHRYAAFRTWENLNFQYRLGLFDEEEYRAHTEGWVRLINGPNYYATYWCDYRDFASPGFKAEMDSLINDSKCQ